METKIVKDIHDDAFTYEIEYKDNSYFVSKGFLQFTKPLKTFSEAIDYIDKHYLDYKKFLSDNNMQTKYEMEKMIQINNHQIEQHKKINIIKEWMGESNGN